MFVVILLLACLLIEFIFQSCINLYKQYVDGFQKMKVDLQAGPDKNLDFSEMYIFGKFETFCKRLSKVKLAHRLIDDLF